MEENHIDKKAIKYLFSYLKVFKKTFLILGIMTIFSSLFTVIIPYFLAYIIDHYLISSKVAFFSMATILFILYLLHIILSRISSLKMLDVSENILYKIRIELFNALQKLPMSYFDKNQKGDIMSRFTSDIEQIGDTISESFVNIISSTISLIGSLILMFYMNVSLSFMILLTVPLFLFLAVKIAVKSGTYFSKQQKEVGELNGYFEEQITGIEVIKAFGVEEAVKEEFDIKNQKLKETQKRATFWSNLVLPLNTIVSNLGNILVLIYGAYLVLDSKITIGMLLAFISYADMFRAPLQELASMFANIQTTLAGASRVYSVIDEAKSVRKDQNSLVFPKNFKQISFDNLSFSYDEKDVLKNVSFTLRRGENLAIVGETGSGKTTLIQLLSKLYRVSDKSIYIDNYDINNISEVELHKKIGIILQEPFLFEGTILENVLYGNDKANNNDAIKALEEAGADFIYKLPNKYKYVVEENGSNLSSGEKQLITIARTILQNPDILILDEATSNVDLFTEKKVYDSMLKLMKKKTSIVIAHRLKTIEQADRIILLEHGKIKEEGNHEELLKKHGKYYTLYMSQFS